MFTVTLLFVVMNPFIYCEPQVTNYKQLNWTNVPMRYIDVDGKNDLFYDRIVSLTLNVPNYQGYNNGIRNFGIGVLISVQRVLTSYNPFRELSRFQNITGKIALYYFTSRYYIGKTVYYNSYHIYNVTCGRQVAYLPDDEITEYQWHGKDRKHCPVHDLMVLKFDGYWKHTNHLKPHEYTHYSQFYGVPDQTSVKGGPFITDLAKAGETLGKKIEFASLGYQDKYHMKTYRFLRATKYNKAEDVIVNCDDWLPRDWGHFICILNIHNYPGLGSGATLFSNHKLFGVGSFVMFREGKSILVFTDVRKYNSLIMNACTSPDVS